MNIRIIFVLIILFLNKLCLAQALQFEKIDLQFEQPVDLVSPNIEGDTRLFVLEKTGKIYIVDQVLTESPVKLEQPFLDISSKINTQQEGGLIGMAFSPEFETKGYFYISYTFNDPSNGQKFSSRISRFTLSEEDGNKADVNSEMEVITIEQPDFNNNGGAIAFGTDGMLYIAMGDGGGANDQYENGQNVSSLLGKILRIDVLQLPYEIPGDNPFTQNPFILDEIWALGLRNPWKISFDEVSGALWIADVGQNDLEEIDVQEVGESALNYGWSCFEGTDMFGPFGCVDGIIHEEPIYEYDHLGTQKAVVGGYVYRGSKFPNLYGTYIFTDYVSSNLFWIISKDGTEYIIDDFDFSGETIPENISTFGEDSAHELYVASFTDGHVWKLETALYNSIHPFRADNLTIKPNPVSERLLILDDIPIKATVKIVDSTGRVVLHSSYRKTLDVSLLDSGIYHVLIQSDNQFWNGSFIKI